MAMNARGLEALLYKKLTTVPVMTNGIVDAKTKQVTKPDGSKDMEITYTKGNIFMDKTQARHMAKAIAEAVVEHVTSAAEDSSGGAIK